jgi:putative transcriptional regulator
MTISHHPTDLTLASFVAGTLDEARSLVVAAHISQCLQCRRAMSAFQDFGGALLDNMPLASMRADAVERAMASIEADDKTPTHAAPRKTEAGLPAALASYDLGPWRRIGGGVWWRSVNVPIHDGVRVFMLKANPGTHLPHHRHSGSEWTCVIEGAFRHEGGRYGPGDFDEADETIEHKPFIEHGPPCICIVALQGRIEFQSWIGRLIQPFVRI